MQFLCDPKIFPRRPRDLATSCRRRGIPSGSKRGRNHRCLCGSFRSFSSDRIRRAFMREVTPETAADYLRETGRVPEGRAVAVRALGGGVSNVVLRVDVEEQPPFVLKQSRERLRTRA